MNEGALMEGTERVIPGVPDWEDLDLYNERGMDTETILEEAQRIIHGDRNEDYGHPADNHGTTAEMMAAFLSRKYRTPIPFDAEDVCWFHIFEKASRDANRPQRDNLTDTAGYAGNIEMIRERMSEEDL